MPEFEATSPLRPGYRTQRGRCNRAIRPIPVRFADDSPVEEGVYCELVSESEISEVSIPVRFWAILVS